MKNLNVSDLFKGLAARLKAVRLPSRRARPEEKARRPAASPGFSVRLRKWADGLKTADVGKSLSALFSRWRSRPGTKTPRAAEGSSVAAALKQLSRGFQAAMNKLIAPRTVTVDIDGGVIKVLECRGGAVRKWATAPYELRGGGDTAAGAAQEAALGAAVRQLMSSGGMGVGPVTLGLTTTNSVSRLMPLSLAPEEPVTPEVVRDAVAEALPLNEDQLYVSNKVVELTGTERQLYIVGSLREPMDAQIRTLQRSGIKARVIESKAVALARAAGVDRALILNVELSSYDAVVVSHYVPTVSHNTVFHPDGLSADDIVEKLALAVQLAKDYHDIRHPTDPLTSDAPLFVTGRLSSSQELVEQLVARTGHPARPLAAAMRFPPDFPASQYAVNIGLALRGQIQAGESKVGKGGLELAEMNLLPQAYRPWRPAARHVYLALALIVAVGLLYPAYQATSEKMDVTARYTARYTSLNSQLDVRKVQIKSREPYQSAIDDYHRLTAMSGDVFAADIQTILDTAGKMRVRVVNIIHGSRYELRYATVADKDVPPLVLVNVEAPDYQTFRDFADALLKTGRFSRAVLPVEGYPFTSSGEIKLQVAGIKQ